MNLRNLIENIKDPNPPTNQGRKDKQSNNLRRRDRPQDLSHAKQHSQDNKNNSKYKQKKSHSSRSRDDPKHVANMKQTLQSRGTYKKNDKTIKIPEKKIIDMERIREEHSQTSLQIAKNQRSSVPVTLDKGAGNHSRISSESDDRSLSPQNKKLRRYHEQDSHHHAKKTVDIKDRVTRKKILPSDAHDDHSEHRHTHRRDDQYSDESDYYNNPRYQNHQKERKHNFDTYHSYSRQRQSASGVSSDNYQKQHIKNNKDTSDSQISNRDKSSDNIKINENKKRRVEKDEKYYVSSEIATHQIANSQDFTEQNKMRFDELQTVKTAKPDVSLKAFLSRNNDVKKNEINSKENSLLNIKDDVKNMMQNDKIITLVNNQEDKIIKEEGNNKNKQEENQMSNSKLLKQSQNTDPADQSQLVEQADGGLVKPRSESIGYKGHQTNHQFQISDSNDSKVFKIPKSKEHKFSDPMTSSVNHSPNDSKDSQNHSHHSDNVIMDEQERENNREQQQLQQEPITIQDDLNSQNLKEDQEMIIDKQAQQFYKADKIDSMNNPIEDSGIKNTIQDPNGVAQAQPKKLSLLSESEKEKLNAYIFTINNFISVSKLVLNRFVVYLQFIKDSYLQQIKDNKPELLQILAISKEQLCQKTQVEFIKVIKCMMAGFENVKDFETALNEVGMEQSKKSSSNQRASQVQNKEMKVNFTSIKHCIKRIQKACQMQIDDFQWKNGIYKEEILLGSIQDDQLSESELNEFMMNKRILRERMQLLMDLIEIEQVSKQYLELFRRNFILLYELVKHDVMDIIFEDQINNQIDTGSDFEEHMRTRAYYIKYSNFLQFNQANFDVSNVKNINSSIIDIFTSDELKQISSSTTLLVSLMEIGNTVDSVTIISKILDKKQKFIRINADCFDKFLIWKKRKCHCCMEYILDGGKAVTCVNIIQEQNPCKNIYCQNCVVAYLEQNSNLSLIENEDLEKEKNKEQKEKENKKLKHKLWLKAQQNILFICPCCQGMCLIEDKEKQKNLEFAKFSICNFNHRIINYPKDFLKKQFYWSRLTCNKRKFQLANVIGICKHKNIYKVELLSTSQIYQIKLQKEEIFFTDSVKNGSKLFKIINSEGFELDLKNIIDKQVKDFDNHSTYSILEKYKNYVDKPDQLNNGFIIPKFNYEQVQYRPELVQETRNLMKRYDNQLFDSFELELQNICHNYNDDEDQNSLFMSQNQSAQQQQFQPMILRQIKETDYRKLNNQGNRLSDDEFEMVENEPEKHFIVEKSMLKGTAKTPFDKLKIERANIKNTPYELTMEPVNGKKDYSLIEDQMILEHHDFANQMMEQQMIANQQQIPIDQNMINLDQGEQWKMKQRHQILNDYQFKENHLADERYRLSHPNIGAMLVQEKNIQFAKDEMNRNQGDRIQLLVNRQVFRIERIGEQSNIPGYIDAIGEIKEMGNFQKPSETYEGQINEQPFNIKSRFEQPLFDVERGASRDQIIDDQMDIDYDQQNEQFEEEEEPGPRPYKIRKIGDSAEIIYDFEVKVNDKVIKRKKSSSTKQDHDDKEDKEDPVTESDQKHVSRNDNAKSEGEQLDNCNESDNVSEGNNSRDENRSMEDQENSSRSRSGEKNYQSQKQMDATRRKQEKARIEREKKIKEQEILLQIQEEQRDIRLAKREEIKRINIFNQIQKRKKQAEERKRQKELNGGKSDDEDEEDDDEEDRQVKLEEEQDIKLKKEEEKSENAQQQQSQPVPEKKWKKPKVHADRLMQQSFLANQQGFRNSLMVDRQNKSQERERNDVKNHTDSQDYIEISDSNFPTNKQKKEAIKQYSEQQKLFTQQHKASPTKIIKNRMLKEKGEAVNQIDLDYLKALEIGEKKEYNLRAGRQKPSPIIPMIPKNVSKPVTTFVKQDGKVESDEESLNASAVIETKLEPRVTRGANRENVEVEEEFYDDFPIEIIKKYNLKISNKRKEEIYLSRRRKTNLKQANQKITPGEQKNKEQPLESLKNNQQIQINDNQSQSQIDNIVNAENTVDQEEKEKPEINQNKESSNSEAKQEQNKESNDKPNYDKLYFRRFVMRPKIEEHHQKLHQIVLTNPHELIGFYIYIYRKSQNLWRRAFIKNFFPVEESKRMYEIEYQNEAKLTKQINLMKVVFIIDYSSESPKNSQDLSKLSKHSNPKSEASIGQNEETRKSIDKLKNYGLFNNKKRVSKMLQKIEEQLEKVEESKKDSIKQENDDNSSLSKLSSQKFQKPIIQEQQADAEVDVDIKLEVEEQELEPVQEELAPAMESVKDLSINIEEPVEDKKNSLEDEAEIKQDEQSEIELSANEFPVKRSNTPKERWIKDMKQKLLSKTRQTSSTQKILKFYHQEIEIDDDFSKSDQTIEQQEAQIMSKSPVEAEQNNQIQQQSIFPPQNYLKNQHKVSFKLKNNPNDQKTNNAQITQDLQQYELQLQHQQQNFIAQKQVHDQQNEKINNMILQINNQEMIKQTQLQKNGEIESQDFNSARDMVQQKLLLSRLQQKSYLIDEQKQKYKEQIQQLYALDLDKPENKENRKIFEQLTYEFEQYCIMQQFMDQIYQQQIQAYFMRQQLDERSLNRDAANSDQERKNSESKDADSDAQKQAQYGPQMQEMGLDPNTIDKNGEPIAAKLDKKMLAAQLEQYNQFQQMQIEYASKTASQQMMNQFYNEKNNYLLMNQVLSAEYLLNLKQQYANELLQEDKEQEEYEQHQQESRQQSFQQQPNGQQDSTGQNNHKNSSVAQIDVVESDQNAVGEADQQTWDNQYSYLKQIQQLLDRIGNIDDDNKDHNEANDQMQETKITFQKIEQGIKVLEQTYQEEKYIEQEIFEILNLDNNQQGIMVPNLINQFKNEAQNDQSNQKEEQKIQDNPEKVENSPKNKQQILDGSEIKPEFFFEHINYLAELKKKQQATIALNFQMRDNQLGDDQESINPSVVNQFEQVESSNMQILQDALDRFYQKQIVFNGFKKCKCQSCFKMVNPILIKYDAESNEFLLQHQQQYNSYSTQNQNINDFKNSLNAQLRQLFTLKKSDQDIQLCLKQQKEKIQKFDHVQDECNERSSLGGNLGTDKEEYLKKYPCFKLLVKRIIEEEENTQEKQNQESQDKQENENLPSSNLLPKLSQIFPENIKTNQFEFNIDLMEKQFEDQIKLLLDQNPEQKENSDEHNEQDIVSAQVKLDLMRTMQKMLVQFKLLKQLEKPKFENNFGRVITQGTKIKSFVQKKRRVKENVKLVEKQKRIEMQNYINSLYRNQYLGQRFGDDENKIWDYTTIQAPGSHPYNYLFQNNDSNMQSEPPVNMKNQAEYAPQNPQPEMPNGFNYGANDIYFAQQQAMMHQQMNFQEEMAHGVQPHENPYMYQHLMGANYRGPKHFINGNQVPMYTMNTYANGGDNHMTNYNSNFNNCQIFQPQIINQNYLTTIPPQQHHQHEDRLDQQDGPKPGKTDIEQSKQPHQKQDNKN